MTALPQLRPPLLEPGGCGPWTLTTYAQCEFRCVYCITGVQGASVPRYARDEIVEQLRRELRVIDRAVHIGVGGLCDAYPDAELEHGVTREVVRELRRQGRPFTVITKGTAVLRDAEVFAGAAGVRVRISLCTVDERALRRVDPRAPTAGERLALVHALRDAGVNVAVNAEPWIPGVSNAQELIDRIDARIPIRFAPLNITSAPVARSAYGRRFSQDAINRAYLLEACRVEPAANVVWAMPIPTDAGATYDPFARLVRPPDASRTPEQCAG